MTPTQQNEAIAKWMGWTKGKVTGLGSWISPEGLRDDLPSYTNDLNAIHGAMQLLKSDGSFARFVGLLESITNVQHGDGVVETFVIVNATAAQRAEALLKTLNLWTE